MIAWYSELIVQDLIKNWVLFANLRAKSEW
jgi:hypothetical protein